MRDAEFDQFADALQQMADSYLQEITADQILAFWNDLREFELDAVRNAMRVARKVHPSFFPKAGELMTLIEGSGRDRAQVAWHTLRQIVDEGGYPSLQIADGGLYFAIENMGGYREVVEKLRGCSIEMERAYEKSFLDLYRLGHAREVAGGYVLGEFEAHNRTLDSWVTVRGRQRIETTELPVPVLLVGTERFVKLIMPLDLTTGKLADVARRAIAEGGDSLRRFLPQQAQPVARRGPETSGPMASPAEIRAIRQAVNVLAGGGRPKLLALPAPAAEIETERPEGEVAA